MNCCTHGEDATCVNCGQCKFCGVALRAENERLKAEIVDLHHVAAANLHDHLKVIAQLGKASADRDALREALREALSKYLEIDLRGSLGGHHASGCRCNRCLAQAALARSEKG